ncbi:MAG: peptidoglycan DD-metalloendopeptidase family protein [Betaproteobacteria bacterium]
MLKIKTFILAQSRIAAFLTAHGGARKWITWGGLVSGCIAAAIIVTAQLHPEAATRLINRDLSIPVVLTDGDTAPVPADFWREEKIQRGDTVGVVLARMGVRDADLAKFIHADPGARPLYRLLPGKSLRVKVDEDGDPVALRYLTRDGDMLEINQNDEGEFLAKSAPPAVATRIQLRSGEIQSSLFGAADAAGMPDPVTMQLAEIFSGDIDFFHDLRRGDRFTVAYEVIEMDGEPIRIGRVLAAEFVNKGFTFRAFHYQDPQLTGPEGGYYTQDGKNLKKAFLRSPMEFSRITSKFTLSRFHPLLQIWRAHKGIDYGAPTGTPVRATGDGIVETAGKQGGYGNFLLLKHQGSYSTAYGHLSRFAAGIHRGSRVQQGQIVAYVGATGWATGPHLHYEFRVNQVQHDPLLIALPTALPVPPEKLAAFRAKSLPLTGQLALARGQQFATAD